MSRHRHSVIGNAAKIFVATSAIGFAIVSSVLVIQPIIQGFIVCLGTVKILVITYNAIDVFFGVVFRAAAKRALG